MPFKPNRRQPAPAEKLRRPQSHGNLSHGEQHSGARANPQGNPRASLPGAPSWQKGFGDGAMIGKYDPTFMGLPGGGMVEKRPYNPVQSDLHPSFLGGTDSHPFGGSTAGPKVYAPVGGVENPRYNGNAGIAQYGNSRTSLPRRASLDHLHARNYGQNYVRGNGEELYTRQQIGPQQLASSTPWGQQNQSNIPGRGQNPQRGEWKVSQAVAQQVPSSSPALPNKAPTQIANGNDPASRILRDPKKIEEVERTAHTELYREEKEAASHSEKNGVGEAISIAKDGVDLVKTWHEGGLVGAGEMAQAVKIKKKQLLKSDAGAVYPQWPHLHGQDN